MTIDLNGTTGITTTGLTSNGIDDNATSTAMTLDTSGNVLVGTTSAFGNTGITIDQSGQFFASRSSNPSVVADRRDTDGDALHIRKNGTTVGSIGVKDGDLTIGTGDTGLYFSDGADAVYPYNTSTQSDRDNAVDLGYPTVRFKDLYLSGGVYLGGTGSANKLDDYEEGNWTPVLQNVTVSYTERYGGYTKIGSIVHLYGYMVISSIDTADTSFFSMGGLPFFGAGAYCNANLTNGTGNPSLFTSAADSAHFEIVSSSNLYLGNLSGTSNLRYSDCCNSSGRFFFHVTYKTNA